MNKLSKYVAIALASILIINIGFVIFFLNNSFSGKAVTETNQVNEGIKEKVTFDNLENYLERQTMIKDLPEDSNVLLKFYNFDSGERSWTREYIINKEGVEAAEIAEGEAPEITVWIHDKYVSELGNGFCSTLKKANQNGDLGYESGMNQLKLGLKYSKFMKYRECLS